MTQFMQSSVAFPFSLDSANMMKFDRAGLFGLALLLLAGLSPSFADDVAILKCADMATVAERIQCYDAAAADIRAHGSSAKPALASTNAPKADQDPSLLQCIADLESRQKSLEEKETALLEAKQAIVEAKNETNIFGLTLGTNGRDELAGISKAHVIERDEDGRAKVVNFGIASWVRTADDLFLAVLENGQVWRQLSGRPVQILKSKPPTIAKITRGMMGGFTMHINDQSIGFPVTRIDKGNR
jgi:hypothetical protein